MRVGVTGFTLVLVCSFGGAYESPVSFGFALVHSVRVGVAGFIRVRLG